MICKCPFLHGWLKYLVCPPIPPLSHLAIIMKKDHGNTACRNSTFLPPPTILFYTSLSALSHLPSTLPVHLLSANSILYPTCPSFSLPPSLPSYFSVLVILPKLQCPPLISPYDNFKSRKNSAQKLNYSLKRWKSTPSLCQIWWLSYLKSKHQQT